MKSLKKLHLFTFIISLFCSITFSAFAEEFNVRDFGALGDGKTVETKAIQKAIDACTKLGGIVLFPAGTYVSGTIYFKDNVTLHLQKGATILGSTNLSDYPENLPGYTFFRKGVIKRALIHGDGNENIAIEGEGTIDGHGSAFLGPFPKGVSSYSVRPYVIWMVECKNVRIEGVKLQNSAFWMQHYLACENVYIHNIEVYNHSNKNNDMMDIDGCKDVVISDCLGDTDDDGITLKSTHERPNENITITNCILSSHCTAIKCGTESNTGFKNIIISNCVIRPSRDTVVIYGKPKGISGISLEVVDGAEMNGIHISNIVMDGVSVPLFIRLGNRARGYDKNLPKPEIGSIQNITISNITAFNVKTYGSSITGIPGHPVKNVLLENIRIFCEGGGTDKDALREIPEKETSYPEATMFGNLPSYGLFIRHAENITLKNIELYFETEELRPALYLEDIEHGKFLDIQADMNSNSPFMQGNNVRDIFIKNPWTANPCLAVIDIKGEQSRSIILSDIDKQKFNEVFKASGEVDKGVVRTVSLYK